MKTIKDLLQFALYSLCLGVITGVSAAILLHLIFGFSLVPCQFDRNACQVGPGLTALPIPEIHLPETHDAIGVSPFSSRLILTTVKPGPGRESQYEERSDEFRRAFALTLTGHGHGLYTDRLGPSNGDVAKAQDALVGHSRWGWCHHDVCHRLDSAAT